MILSGSVFIFGSRSRSGMLSKRHLGAQFNLFFDLLYVILSGTYLYRIRIRVWIQGLKRQGPASYHFILYKTLPLLIY
jgi:hypothetical protein